MLEESVLEGCCFGTPILDARNEAIAAIAYRRRRCASARSSFRSVSISALRRASERVGRVLRAGPGRA